MDRLMLRLSRSMAYLGGAVLIILMMIVCVSIAGRALITIAYMPLVEEGMPWLSRFLIRIGMGPINGDYEIVEAGMAFAIFAFLPWCQVNRGHAVVDVFTSRFPASANRLIDLLAELLMLALFVLIAWQLWHGMADKLRYGETTFTLQFPIWWAYAASVFGAVMTALTALWMVSVRLREAMGADPLTEAKIHDRLRTESGRGANS